ncbi:MAG: YcxB family protein [Clostridia bacterium]|nr:YcxB family protein [Clostridia bacterium]
MESLYKTKTINTFEEYKRFSRVLMYKKRSIIIYALLAAFLILDGIVLDNMIFIVFAVVYPFVIWLLHNMQVKKVFKTNKALQNAEVNFEFYNDYFTETNEYGNTKLEYNKLHKIIETKTNFYLMIAKNQGFILVKENFPEGLEEFLRNIKIS